MARNSAVSIHLESGNDVIILEGSAVEADLTDKPFLKKIDAASRAKYKMPLTVMSGETMLYSVHPRIVLAWTEKDFVNNATRWTFDNTGD